MCVLPFQDDGFEAHLRKAADKIADEMEVSILCSHMTCAISIILIDKKVNYITQRISQPMSQLGSRKSVTISIEITLLDPLRMIHSSRLNLQPDVAKFISLVRSYRGDLKDKTKLVLQKTLCSKYKIHWLQIRTKSVGFDDKFFMIFCKYSVWNWLKIAFAYQLLIKEFSVSRSPRANLRLVHCCYDTAIKLF